MLSAVTLSAFNQTEKSVSFLLNPLGFNSEGKRTKARPSSLIVCSRNLTSDFHKLSCSLMLLRPLLLNLDLRCVCRSERVSSSSTEPVFVRCPRSTLRASLLSTRTWLLMRRSRRVPRLLPPTLAKPANSQRCFHHRLPTTQQLKGRRIRNSSYCFYRRSLSIKKRA